MQAVVRAYKDKGDANGVKQVQSAGLHIGGERFIVLKADERSIYGKKVGCFAFLFLCLSGFGCDCAVVVMLAVGVTGGHVYDGRL